MPCGVVTWSGPVALRCRNRDVGVTDLATAGLVDDASSGRSKSVIRRLSGTVSEASMPPAHLGHAGSAPLVRISPTADCTITGSVVLGRSSGCGGWFSQTPRVEPEACGGFKRALAAPLVGHGQKSSGRCQILGVGGAVARTAATRRRPGSNSRKIVSALEQIPRPTFRIGKKSSTPRGEGS